MSSAVAKDIVRTFYESDFIHDIDVFNKYIHPDVLLEWHSSFGFFRKNFNDLQALFSGMSSSFTSFRCETNHLMAEGNTVTVQFAVYVKMIERPDIEVVLGYFMAIWELKDGQLLKGYQISQTADSSEVLLQ